MNKLKYCCERFAEAVKEKEIIHATDNDETEWFIDELWHIYYCPFCGTNIKGKGYGKYKDNKESTDKMKKRAIYKSR